MPIYNYKCNDCEKADDAEHYRFTKLLPISKMDSQVECPHCKHNDTTRVLSTFCMKISQLTVAHKAMGITEARVDMGNYMKEARNKRKQEFGPDTKEGASNEYWTGGEYDKTVWKDIPKP